MMKRWVRSVAILPALALGACGFQPLYGTLDSGMGVGMALSEVYVDPIPDRVGYELRNNLLDLFNATGRADTASYRLKLYLTGAEDAVVLQPNTAITRYNVTLRAHYDLVPKGKTESVKSGEVTAFAAYNVAAAPFLYATVTAQRDAQNRAASDIAERIHVELAVYLREAAMTAAR